ncbi:MAG TPA: type II toxin-antitoxin system RelE/ParE family toxin [Longimicrobiaceae bacterium]|nr:type II toxin-antitoxin system RelE/ParE family toxin [Longimicrobiaceae bacterium]
MTPVVLHPAARAELREAVTFYRVRSIRLARELLAEVRATIARLQELPGSGAPAAQGTRRALVKRFPFTVIYAVETDRIFVYAIMHQRREPEYWSERTRQGDPSPDPD